MSDKQEAKTVTVTVTSKTLTHAGVEYKKGDKIPGLAEAQAKVLRDHKFAE